MVKWLFWSKLVIFFRNIYLLFDRFGQKWPFFRKYLFFIPTIFDQLWSFLTVILIFDYWPFWTFRSFLTSVGHFWRIRSFIHNDGHFWPSCDRWWFSKSVRYFFIVSDSLQFCWPFLTILIIFGQKLPFGQKWPWHSIFTVSIKRPNHSDKKI